MTVVYSVLCSSVYVSPIFFINWSYVQIKKISVRVTLKSKLQFWRSCIAALDSLANFMPVLTLERLQYGINASFSVLWLPLILQFVFIFYSIGKISSSVQRASKDMCPCTRWCDINIQSWDRRLIVRAKNPIGPNFVNLQNAEAQYYYRRHAPTELQSLCC